jgi:DNA mismatch repair protein MutL
MPNITVLDQNTINKIAAGEVIERPASVVKELLENAIDAKSTAVTVEIKEGGTSFIRVTDNGCGIPKEEVPLAFLRHSTSKIKSVEDLFTISSLGFRGEALASIAAVSQVELITKTSAMGLPVPDFRLREARNGPWKRSERLKELLSSPGTYFTILRPGRSF